MNKSEINNLRARIFGAARLPIKFLSELNTEEIQYNHFFGYNFQRLAYLNFGLIEDEFPEMIEQLWAEYRGWA